MNDSRSKRTWKNIVIRDLAKSVLFLLFKEETWQMSSSMGRTMRLQTEERVIGLVKYVPFSDVSVLHSLRWI